MSQLKSILNQTNGHISVVKDVSSASELKELFQITPQVEEAIRSTKGTADMGAALTRNVLLGETDALPDDIHAKVTVSESSSEVTIGDGCQWEIPSNSNQIITLDKLTLGKGASIKVVHTTLNLKVGKLLRAAGAKSSSVPVGKILTDSSATTYDIGIFGSKGMKGAEGTQGNNGAHGTSGNNAECGGGGGTPIGGLSATNGMNGGNGSDGGNGGNGADGNPSMIAVITLTDIDSSVGTISVSTYSGEGGDGGNGGKGGNGGDGGKGGDGTQCGCTGMDAANGGDGGNGGNGGKGGNGGNGVNGQTITIDVPTSFGASNVLVSSENAPAGSKGIGGLSGSAGKGGARGNQGHKYSNDGRDGKSGENGEVGENGEDGKNYGLPGSVKILKH